MELAGYVHPISYNQWLNVQVETSNERFPIRVYTSTNIFNIFISDTECLAPQQVCWQHQAVWCSRLTGGKWCHPQGPWLAWEVGLCKPHEVQQGQIKSSAVKLSMPIQTETWMGWEHSWREALGHTGGWRVGHVCLRPRKRPVSWVALGAALMEGWGRWFSPSREGP